MNVSERKFWIFSNIMQESNFECYFVNVQTICSWYEKSFDRFQHRITSPIGSIGAELIITLQFHFQDNGWRGFLISTYVSIKYCPLSFPIHVVRGNLSNASLTIVSDNFFETYHFSINCHPLWLSADLTGNWVFWCHIMRLEKISTVLWSTLQKKKFTEFRYCLRNWRMRQITQTRENFLCQ